jgi:hypothetical protein
MVYHETDDYKTIMKKLNESTDPYAHAMKHAQKQERDMQEQ